jgi:hypothetical protein
MYFSSLSKVVLSHCLLWHIGLWLRRWEQYDCGVDVEVVWEFCVQIGLARVQRILAWRGVLHVSCSSSPV